MKQKDLRVEYQKLSDYKDKVELEFRRAGLNDSAFSLSIHPKNPEQPYEGYAVFVYLVDKENEVSFGFCAIEDEAFVGFVQNNLLSKYWEEQSLGELDSMAEGIEVVENFNEFMNFFFKRPYVKMRAEKAIKNRKLCQTVGVN